MPKASEIISCVERQLRSVMLSKQPTKLCHYYEQYGLKFKTVKINDRNHFLSVNSNISILETDLSKDRSSCLGGLAIYEKSNLGKEFSSLKYNNRNDLFYGFFSFLDENLSSNLISTEWINIIRSKNIEEAVEFYKKAGPWTLEKHGNGPFHYALVQNSNVFELYPLRKNGATSIEYLVKSHSSSDIHYDLDGRRIQFYKS